MEAFWGFGGERERPGKGEPPHSPYSDAARAAMWQKQKELTEQHNKCMKNIATYEEWIEEQRCNANRHLKEIAELDAAIKKLS